jgi:Protein of unknown function (DUF1350).
MMAAALVYLFAFTETVAAWGVSPTRISTTLGGVSAGKRSSSSDSHGRHSFLPLTRLHVVSNQNDIGDDDDNNNNVERTPLNLALAKLDRQWRINNNQRVSNRPTGGIAGWTKFLLMPSSDTEASSSSTRTRTSTSASTTTNDIVDEKKQWRPQQDFVYLLEPPSTPSMVILFLGGAGLGQYPHIAYSEFLSRISKRLNAAIIAAPYPLSLDHFELSKQTGDLFRRAIVQCEDEGGYSKTLPKFYLGHSLGSKLLAIALAASGGGMTDVNGIGFLSYNNFGFRDTLSMVKDFASDLNLDMGMGMGGGSSPSSGVNAGRNVGTAAWNLDSILNLAGEAMSMMGIDFDPDPVTMDRIVEMKYNQELQKKTKLFRFDQDDLDCSVSFLNACQRNTATSTTAVEAEALGSTMSARPSISELKGNHLSPVYVKVSMDDLYALEFPQEAMPFVTEASGGFQCASFGEEEVMNGAVNEICAWIMEKEEKVETSDGNDGPTTTARRLSAGTTDMN